MLFNQPSSLDEVVANGITPENTGIQSKDYYKNIDAVQQTFTQNGKFDEVAFDNFYNSALKTYNEFSDKDWTEKLVNEMAKDPFDWTQPLNTNVKNISATIQNGNNPERRNMSITGIGTIGGPVFSIREIAQDNEVRDLEGNKLGWTPNQKGAVGSIFEPTVVLAQWDEDGEHIANGRKVMHKKGDYKTDENGDYFYELLGNREAYDKEILKFSDVLTVDGTSLNKWDPFDSDGLTKSVGSTIAKTALEILPLLTPFGKVYGTISAITNLASVLPTLGKSINGILTGSNDNGVGRTLTQMENWFGRFDETSSDYAKEKFASLENIGNILASSAKQLYQQKSLAELTKFLNKSDALRASKIGQHVSLGYLALTSSEGVYADFKRAGASDAVAGLGMLASTAALYELMDLEYFRDQLFKGTFMDESEAIGALKNYSRDELGKVHNIAKTPSQQEAIGIFNQLKDKIKEKWGEFLKTPFAGKHQGLITGTEKAWGTAGKFVNRAINEGLEETAEEIAFDAVKGLFSAMDAIGIPMTEDRSKSLDFGFSVKDNLTRYLTSFVGGALGGAVFEGINLYEQIGANMVDLSSKSAKDQMTYLIVTGHADELRDRAKVLYDKKMLGNDNLSAYKTVDVNGETYYAEGDKDDNQNLANYNAILNHINFVEDVLWKHDMMLRQDVFSLNPDGTPKLNDKFVEEMKKQSEIEKKEKIDSGEYTYRKKENALTRVVDRLKLDSSYVNELVKLGSELTSIESELVKLRSEKKVEGQEKRNERIKFLEEKLKVIKEAREELFSGKRTDVFAHQLMFTTSHSLRDTFMGMPKMRGQKNDPMVGAYWSNTKEGYVKSRYGKNWEDLTELEQEEYEKEFKAYKDAEKAAGKDGKDAEVDQLIQASRIHYDILERTADDVKATEELLKKKTLDNYHNHGHIAGESSDFEKYTELQIRNLEIREEVEELENQLNELIANWNESEGNVRTTEEYIKIEEEIQNLHQEILNIQLEINNFEDLYGSEGESADGFFKGQLIEEITEEGKKNLYDSLIKTKRLIRVFSKMIDTFIKRDIIFQNLTGDLAFLAENGLINITPEQIANLRRDGNYSEIAEILNHIDIETLGDDIDMPVDDETKEKLIADRNTLNEYNFVLKQNTKENLQQELQQQIESYFDQMRKYYKRLKDKKIIVENDALLKKVLSHVASLISVDFTDSSIISQLDVPEDSEASESLPANLQTFVKDFYAKLSNGDFSEAYATYTAAVNQVKDAYQEYESSEDPEQYVKSLFNEFALGTDIIGFLEEIDLLKAEITTFSAIDLIRGAELNIDGHTLKLIELLEQEENSFLKAQDIESYIISDPMHRTALNEARRLLSVISSVVQSAYTGVNAVLNDYRKNAGKEKLPDTISESTKDIVFSDISYLLSKIYRLLDLSDQNSKFRKDFHRRSEIKIKTDFVKNLLLNVDENDSFIKRLSKQFFGDDEDYLYKKIKTLLEEHKVDPSKVDFDNFKDFNKFFIALSDLLYKEFHEKINLTDKNDVDKAIGEKLAAVLPTDAYLLLTGEVTDKSEPEDNLSELSTVIMLGAIASNETSAFYSNLKAVQKSYDKIVPIVGQEWNIQLGVALAESPEVFNAIVKGIANTVPDKDLDENAIKYLESKTILENFIFIQGGAGSGKTSVVAKMIADIVKINNSNIEIITGGPETTQVESIQKSLGSKKSYSFATLMSKIAPNWETWITTDHLESGNGHQAKLQSKFIGDNVTSSADVLFDKKSDKKILILDEITFLSERELQILTHWASTNNVIIIGLGDRKQNAKKETINNKPIQSGIEDCFFISGPELTASIRNHNIAKQMNLEKLTVLVNSVLSEYRKKPWLDNTQLNTFLKTLTQQGAPKTKLVYFHDEGKSFVGEKFIKSKDVISYANEFVALSTEFRKDLEDADDKKPKVLLITDEVEKWQALEEKGVTVLSSSKAQGGEYDFVIIDKNFDLDNQYDTLRDFYTSISRSRIGTVIVDNDDSVKNLLNIENVPVESTIKDKPVSFADDADSLREWKMESIDFIDATGEGEGSSDEGDSDSGGSGEVGGSDDPSLGAVVSSDTDDGAPGTIDTSAAKINHEKHLEQRSAERIKTALDPNSESNKKIEQHIVKKNKGSITANREAFIKQLYKELPRDEARFYQLFSSAVMFNLQDIKEHHIKKMKREQSLFNEKQLRKLAKQWNEEKTRIFNAVYDPKTNMSAIRYKFGDTYIPIAMVEGRVEGTLELDRKESLFKQVTSPILIESEDKSVKLSDAIEYGSTYTKNRIFAHKKGKAAFGRSGSKSGHWSVYENEEFISKNNGKTFTLWSECELMTDEDFEEMFQHHVHEGKYDGYLDAKEIETEVWGRKKEEKTILYRHKNGTQTLLLNVKRITSLSEIYDIVCIARFAAGRTTFDKLSSAQKELIGNKNDVDAAEAVVRGVIGNFAIDKLLGTDASKNKEIWAQNLRNLKGQYRLLSSDSAYRLMGALYQCFTEAKNPKWMSGFTENIFKLLRKGPIQSKTTDSVVQNCLRIKIGSGKNAKYYLAKFDPKGYYDIYEFSYDKNYTTSVGKKVGEIKASGTKLKLFDIVSAIPGNESLDETKFYDILKNKQLEFAILKESTRKDKDGNTKKYHDIADDYDYIFGLLNGIPNLDLSVIDKLMDDTYFSDGFFLNDAGGVYQVGKDTNSNDDSRTDWRVHDVSIKERYAAVAGIKSSTFELAHEFEVPNEGAEGDTVGGSPVALRYLLEGGPGTIKTIGYFLHAVAAAFPRVSNEIEAVLSKYPGVLGWDFADYERFAHLPAINEIAEIIKNVYGEDGQLLLLLLMTHPDGFYPKDGKEIQKHIDDLEAKVSTKDNTSQDSTKIISEYKENIVSLLEYHEDVDEQLVNDLFEKYKNEPDISTMINNILQEINQNTIAYDLVLMDGKIDVEQKGDGSDPADINNGVEKVGDVIKIEIDNVDKIITFSEDSDGKMTMMIEVDDPNVESLELPSDFVNGVRNALQTINPNWGIVNNFEQWSTYLFDNGDSLPTDIYDLLESMYSALTDMTYCI